LEARLGATIEQLLLLEADQKSRLPLGEKDADAVATELPHFSRRTRENEEHWMEERGEESTVSGTDSRIWCQERHVAVNSLGDLSMQN
jgi:hypothetical protein